ncbi:MAG TPA: ATPase, T2SS/T4P/T4SS family [Phycisphaerales bacterium]|nr:ATPase, T2SS/T4P/T4SS family [Phycisphaerales bacterium]
MPTFDALSALSHTGPLTLLADQKSAEFLVSFYKPILLLVLFIPWAWVVSKVFDKHAAQFFLPRRTWNGVHMGVALLALGAWLGVGLLMAGAEYGFWIGLGIALILLGADLYAFVHFANRDDRVPERHHITWSTFFKREAKKEKAVKGPANIKFVFKGLDEKGKYSKVLPIPAADTPEMEVRAAAEKLYAAALAARSAQIDIGPAGTSDGAYGVKFMVDGVLMPAETMPPANAARIMDFFKSAAGLDVSDRRRKLQGNFQIEETGGANRHTMRATSMGAQGGMRVSLVIDPEAAVMKKAEDLGMLPMQLAELTNVIDDAKGVVILTTPRDAGRTTLLYSVLRKHDAYTSNVQTVELEPQATLEGVRVNKFDSQAEGGGAGNVPAGSTGPEFSTLVRSIMRRDPQVVGVADLPDAATAKEISRADLDRARIYVSFNASDIISGVQAWVRAVGDQRSAGEALHGAIAGKLVRKLCTNCRVAYPPAPDMLKKLGIPEGKVQTLFKKGGQVLIKNKPEPCPVCQGTGYFGQEGVYEVCLFDKEARDLIVAGNLNGLRAYMRTKRKAPTLQQAAIRKAVDGVTSVEEVMRITGDGAAPAAGAQPPPSGGKPSAGPNGPAPAPKPPPSKPAKV